MSDLMSLFSTGRSKSNNLENIPAKLFNLEDSYFENVVSMINNDNIPHVLLYEFKRMVYNKCSKILKSTFDQLQSKFIIGVCSSNDVVHYYLEKISNKTFQKYKDDTDDFYFINHKKHNKLKEGYNVKFYYKDNNFVIAKRKSNNMYLYFIGSNRKKHYENYLKFFQKYKENNMSITKKNIYINSQGRLSLSSTSTNGRSEGSVIYKGKNELFKFLDSWIESMEYMYSLGLSHKVGILLSGKPGTGKTSLARMIATKYNLNIVKVDFNAVSKLIIEDDYLNQLNNSMVLIEDIDCLVTSRDELNDITYKENFQALLQLLDGVKTFKKTIFVATTNHKEKLDKALTRDGRFDIKIHMEDMDKRDAIELCKNFNVAEEKIINNEKFPINPAYLQNKITTYILKNIKNQWVNIPVK